MQDRSLTVGDLTDLLSYKSKTTLARALKQNTGVRGLQKLYHDMLLNGRLALTESEKQQLADSLQLCLRGEDLYLLNRELQELIFSPIPPSQDLHLICQDRTHMELSTLEKQLQGCQCDIILLNSCYSSVSAFLGRLVPALSSKSSIVHYVYFQQDAHRMIRNIHTMITMLRSNLYQMYALHPDSGDQSIRGDVIVIRCHSADGAVVEYELILYDGCSGILNEGDAFYNKWRIFLEHYRDNREPLRTVSSDGQLLEVLQTYEQLENKSNIYKLKSDLCLCYIPENIVRAALEDGCRAAHIQLPDAMFKALSSIHKRRFENLCAHRKLKHLVLTLTAMENFVRTGCLSDHFYLMRPYTPWERMQILTFCINQQKSNPFVHFYFLKPEMEQKLLNGNMIELICFEKNCVQIIPSVSDYNFSNGHTEIFIHDEQCVELTTSFFQKELLKNDVTSSAETLKYFNYLASILSALISAEEDKQPY